MYVYRQPSEGVLCRSGYREPAQYQLGKTLPSIRVIDFGNSAYRLVSEGQ